MFSDTEIPPGGRKDGDAHARFTPVRRARCWTRHHPAVSFCLVASIEGGSVVTACRGRWPTEDVVEIHDQPEHAERCAECVRVAVDARMDEFAGGVE